MRLVSFDHHSRRSYGIVNADGVIDVGRQLSTAHPTLKSVLATPEVLRKFEQREAELALSELTLLPPVPDPGRILCVGLNYRSHIAETGRDTPLHPMLFPRYPETLVGSGEALIRPRESVKYDYEGELAFVIGKGGRRIASERALEHVAGFACFNDGSIRDYQRHTTQFLPGKNFWRSGAFGPWLVTLDDAGPVGSMTLSTRVDGAEVQRARLDDLLFGVEELIAYISSFLPLLPGDVVATGTTGGVGVFRDPPLWLRHGSTVEVAIDRLGVLRNSVADESDTEMR